MPARLSACRGVLVDSNILGLAACAEQALDAALLAGKCFLLYGRRGRAAELAAAGFLDWGAGRHRRAIAAIFRPLRSSRPQDRRCDAVGGNQAPGIWIRRLRMADGDAADRRSRRSARPSG